MKDETRKKLNDVLGKYDASQQLASKEADERNAEEDAFLAAFYDRRLTVIKPAMEIFAKRLRDRGHGAFVTEENDAPDAEARVGGASIRLHVFPGDPQASHAGRLHDTAGISFIATTSGNKVSIHVSTIYPGSGSGSAGDTGAKYSPDQINSEVVEEAIIDALTKIFAED